MKPCPDGLHMKPCLKWICVRLQKRTRGRRR